MDEVEDRTSNLGNKVAKSTQSEQQKEKRILKNKNGLRNLCYNIKYNNTHILGVSEGEQEE